MASITRESNGRKTIQFVGPDGKRRSLRLGKCGIKAAEGFKVHVEQLVAAKITGHALQADTAHWLAEREDTILDKLAAVGLVAKRQSATLAAFLDAYIADRTDAKPNTLIVWRQTRRCLVEFFGAAKPLREITPGDADRWRLWLGEQGLSENTVNRRCGFAKQFFRSAMRQRLLRENPFGDLEGTTVRANRERDYFITQDEAQQVLDACPDPQWRLLFALSRFGGLRCPSEHLALKWGDIDWERERITVTSAKTEHHAGKGTRIIPLFPELRLYLEAVFDQAEPGTEFCITRYREPNANLRTQLMKIIKRAGSKPWPRLFHNLRSSRQTELAARFPLHVVCEWLGNSKLIAQEHYLRVTEADFAKAKESAPVDAVQNPVQQADEMAHNGSHDGSDTNEKTPVLQGVASHYDASRNGKVDRGGIEPPTPGFSVLCSTN
jgi:integrase